MVAPPHSAEANASRSHEGTGATDGNPPTPEGLNLGPSPPFHRRLESWVWQYPIPFLALAGLALGLYLSYIGGRPDLGQYVWFGSLLVGGLPLVYATGRRLLRREFASDIIASLAIVAAIALDQPFAGVIIVLMQSGGEAIENYAHRHATASLDRLVQRAPRWAYRYERAHVVQIPVDSVIPGDRLVVRPGDVVPVDGNVAAGSATVDESSVTGEPLPRTRYVGDPLLSGVVNVGSAFDLAAVRPSRESQYARIVELVRTAQTKKPAIQRLADRYATWFTPTTVVVAVLAAIFDHSAVTGLAVLVVATPCPLILATPIAVLRAMDRASAQGIIVKSGAAMEEMGRAQAVLFDKTGTLTTGHAEVDRVVPFGDLGAEGIVSVAAALEQYSAHPLARALLHRATGIALPSVTGHREVAGAGVSGTVLGRQWAFGSRSFCAAIAHRPLDPEWESLRRSEDVEGRLVSFLLRDGAPIGAVLFIDPIRPEAIGLAARLETLGVRRVALLTGDNPENANAIARQAGITEVKADLRPEQKVERVGEDRRQLGSTIMVGDGINDAAALATASVGIAMGAQGAGVTSEAADAVLLVDDVGLVGTGIALGQRMLTVAQQGIYIGLGTSLVLMGIASFGFVPPADGALIQEALDVAVIFNALRVR